MLFHINVLRKWLKPEADFSEFEQIHQLLTYKEDNQNQPQKSIYTILY